MKILNIAQGSDEWKEIRKNYFVSSEAAVIMGDSPHMKREELLRLKSTGVEREINEWVEKFVFKRGHEVEALARPIAEARLGDDLYPLTGVAEVEGLLLLSSYDGLTAPLHDDHWEHKQKNQDLFDLVKADGELEPKHYWQLEHQLATRGGESCIFAVSDGTEENYAELRYYSRPERRARLLEGYRVFLQDRANYIPEEVKPVAVAQKVEMLPSIFMRSNGRVSVSHNLSAFESALGIFLEDKLMRSPQTDDDFATLKAQIKVLENAETALGAAGEQILAEIDEVDAAIKKRDALHQLVRSNRLMAEKLVKSEEQNRKSEIISAVKKEWDDHVAEINSKLPIDVRLPPIFPDFAGAVRAKKTLATYKDAAKTELARMKGEANIWRNHIEQNLEMLNVLAADYMFLFRDLQSLIVKDKEALEAIAKQRISEHKQAEDARVKAEAERIAAETEKKRQAEAAKAEADRIAATTQANESENPAPAECPSSLHEWDMLYGNTATASVPAPVERIHTRPSFANKNVRPTDSDIIKVLALHYRVHESKVVEWLLDMDLNGEADQVAQNL